MIGIPSPAGNWPSGNGGWFHIQGIWTHFCVDCGCCNGGQPGAGKRCFECYQAEIYFNQQAFQERRRITATKRVQRMGTASITAAAQKLTH